MTGSINETPSPTPPINWKELNELDELDPFHRELEDFLYPESVSNLVSSYRPFYCEKKYCCENQCEVCAKPLPF